jgi:hypothetical protein
MHSILVATLNRARRRLPALAVVALLSLSTSLTQTARGQQADCAYEDRDAPCALSSGSVVSGYIREQGGRNYFWFGAPERDTRTHIELTDLPADYDLYLFSNTDRDPLAKSVNEGAAPELIDLTLQDAGVYYVYVVSDPSLPFSAEEPYSLALTLTFPKPTPEVVATPTLTPFIATPTPVALVSIPPVLGRTGDAAAGAIRDTGLVPVVRVADRFSEHGQGTVAAQDPPAGTLLQPGSVVVVFVATGNVQIPAVANQPELNAEAILHEAGLQSDTVRRASQTIPSGLTIDTDPTAGMVAPSGSRVRVFISQGS